MAEAMRRRIARFRRERGAELIEFALILPLILVLLMGIFDFGLAFQRYEVITNAAREGARLGSLAATYSTPDIQGRVAAYCAAANLPGGCPGTNTQNTPGVYVDKTTKITLPGGTQQAVVKVTVVYPHRFSFLGPVMALIRGASFGTVNLRATSTMRCESGCT